MPKTEVQFKEMRERSKRHIIDTAMKLFSKNGFHLTSINSIAKEAGIAKGLLYNYFSSKEDLLGEIIKDSLNEYSQYLNTYVSRTLEKEDFISLIEAIFGLVKRNKATWKLFLRILLESGAGNVGKDSVQHHLKHIEIISEEYFRKRVECDSIQKSKTITALIHGALLSYIISDDDETFELIKEEIIKIIST